jgi:hypothetical protein
MKGKRNKTLIVGLILVLVVFSVYTGWQFYKFNQRRKSYITSYTWPVTGIVSKGVIAAPNFTSEKIDFGIVSPKSIIKRELNINNSEDVPVRLEFELSGNISKCLQYGMPKKIIPSNATVNLSLSFKPDESTIEGTYTGNLTLHLFRAEDE